MHFIDISSIITAVGRNETLKIQRYNQTDCSNEYY